ncbi:hypothetical protein BLA60_27200 [Actinophytocola xinjiangensis]|uniref:4-amino-4-deoxy-L-arabinose transferase-like glycosyltransferase n=1 Tax=Actinophytocola xinjiangensis TaxID=485602 RepID=A0A7Z1AVR4_9PSEU|nr:DUF6541 family protein [Actinophytocola xinjiangensis]OLF07602.1 hypothetical protein BLA60_27200 [Actinophytocola xinjiangensis]
MNWLDAVPIALVTIAWLLLPGLAVSYAIGLRGIAAFGLAPITSIAIIASTAVVAEKLGIDWSVWIALVASAATVAVAGAVAFPLRRRALFTADPDPRRLSLAALAGWVPGLVLGAITIGGAVSSPDALSQTYDALFHYNALAYIADSHQASSLTLSTLGNPEVPPAFYPAGWHDVASLVMMTTGTSIPVAANLVTFVGAIVVWPLACLLLVRQLFGRNLAALAVTGVVSVGFTAFPWDLLGFGVLWPNLLGMSFAPAALAVVFTLTRWTRDDAIGVGRAWIMFVVALVAAGFAHPNVLFSVAVLSIFPIAARIFVRAWELHRAGRTARGAIESVLFVAVAAGGWYWAATTPAFAATRKQFWPPFETPANAVGEVALNATHNKEALWLLSALVIVGFFAARRYPNLRLIVAGHLATTFLYVLTAAINRPDTQKFTGYWYNDSHRLAAMIPITAVPLAVGGILLLTAKVLSATEERAGWRSRVAAAGSAGIAVALAVVLVAATGGLYPSDRQERISAGYNPRPAGVLTTPDMREFFERVADEVPEDALIAGNPFNGSAMLWALGDREVLFPHFRGEHSPEQEYLANNMENAATDPLVCQAATDLGVDYLLVGEAEFRPSDGKWKYYSGVNDPRFGTGFELVDEQGGNKLYRLTACGTASQQDAG